MTFLKLKTIRDSGVHTLSTIDENGNEIPDVRNAFGHVINRCDRFCSEENIKKFKKVKSE